MGRLCGLETVLNKFLKGCSTQSIWNTSKIGTLVEQETGPLSRNLPPAHRRQRHHIPANGAARNPNHGIAQPQEHRAKV